MTRKSQVETLPVIFRVFQDGEVIAIFPTVEAYEPPSRLWAAGVESELDDLLDTIAEAREEAKEGAR